MRGQTVGPVALLLAIMCAGFALRYGWFLVNGGSGADYFVWANAHYFGGISKGYLQLVDVLRSERPWVSIRPPGYSMVLLVLDWLGANGPQQLRLYQAAVDCLTCIPLFYVAFRLTGSRVAGFLAATGYALSPLFAWNAVTLMAEALVPLLMASLLALMLYARDGSAWRWLALGVCAGFALLVRSDLLLFAGFIALWWFFATGRRLAPIVAAIVGVALPSLLWFAHGHWRTGHYTTVSAGGYALWSGLGQLPNKHGYVVSDLLAGELMQRRGPIKGPPEADPYWIDEYKKAWREHPGHVIKTILWRVSAIPFGQTEPTGPHRLGGVTAFYVSILGLPVLLLCVGMLLYRGRRAAAFIVSLPVVYAVASLAPVYYEPRYVRYLVLAYILAPLVVLANVPRRNLAYGMLCGLFLVDFAWGLPALRTLIKRKAAEAQIVAGMNAGTARLILQMRDMAWRKLSPGAEYRVDDGGLHLTTDNRPSAYQIAAPLPEGRIQIEYEATLTDGSLSIGILSPNGREFYAAAMIGIPGVNRGKLISANGGALVISSATAEPGQSRATFQRIDVKRVD